MEFNSSFLAKKWNYLYKNLLSNFGIVLILVVLLTVNIFFPILLMLNDSIIINNILDNPDYLEDVLFKIITYGVISVLIFVLLLIFRKILVEHLNIIQHSLDISNVEIKANSKTQAKNDKIKSKNESKAKEPTKNVERLNFKHIFDEKDFEEYKALTIERFQSNKLFLISMVLSGVLSWLLIIPTSQENVDIKNKFFTDSKFLQFFELYIQFDVIVEFLISFLISFVIISFILIMYQFSLSLDYLENKKIKRIFISDIFLFFKLLFTIIVPKKIRKQFFKIKEREKIELQASTNLNSIVNGKDIDSLGDKISNYYFYKTLSKKILDPFSSFIVNALLGILGILAFFTIYYNLYTNIIQNFLFFIVLFIIPIIFIALSLLRPLYNFHTHLTFMKDQIKIDLNTMVEEYLNEDNKTYFFNYKDFESVSTWSKSFSDLKKELIVGGLNVFAILNLLSFVRPLFDLIVIP